MLSFTLQINWKQHFFVPSDEEKGIAILTTLLASYPAMVTDAEQEAIETKVSALRVSNELPKTSAIELQQWIIEPQEFRAENQIEEQAKPTEEMSAEIQLEPTAHHFQPEPRTEETTTQTSWLVFGESQTVKQSRRKRPAKEKDSSQMTFDFMLADTSETASAA